MRLHCPEWIEPDRRSDFDETHFAVFTCAMLAGATGEVFAEVPGVAAFAAAEEGGEVGHLEMKNSDV